MKTLAIETSCDDTSLAIVSRDGGDFVVEKILSYTQTKEHQQRGGVVPEIAARAHAEKILVVLDELDVNRAQIDCISVTAHPGLPGALVVGVTTAYTLSIVYNKPVVEVHHIMGHVFSVLIERSLEIIKFPYVCLTVSGGHNDLYLISDRPEYDDTSADATRPGGFQKQHHLGVGQTMQVGSFFVTKLGQTIDDAAGECFDKVARMLGGPYPGGKRIGDLADRPGAKEHSDNLSLHAATLPDQPYNVSFSGIKGQLHQHIESGRVQVATHDQQAGVAFAFQEQVTSVLSNKLRRAANDFSAQTVGVVGGVSANTRLRTKITEDPMLSTTQLLFPTKFVYCTDNAAMIGVVGLLMFTP